MAIPPSASPDEAWQSLVALANTRLDTLATMRLDRQRARLLAAPPTNLVTPPVRLAVLGSSTVDHLLPAIRVGGLRRGLWVDTFTPAYGQYAQELMDPASDLRRFRPDVVLFALDGPHLLQGLEGGTEVDEWLERRAATVAGYWQLARQAFGCQIIQTIPLPLFVPILGGNEHRLPSSPVTALRRLSAMLRERSDAEGADIVSLDVQAGMDGLAAWHDPALWHRAKQEIHPNAAPLYGDLVARLIAAARGRSYKCLVLDLDNTLWGGVIGDDGLEGIELGQGSAAGEAHVAFQRYVRDLGRRGVILAVCSKNDEAQALQPFERHPEMVLRRADIACFVANWTDKAANLRHIAQRLNIGLDSLAFADDNPAERAIVRRELPMVAVPELPEDPTLYAACLADAGYFEARQITQEDLARTQQYLDNQRREALATSATDIPSYLRSLQMRLIWSRFDRLNQPRIVQLINKTNQFNLTTVRVSDEDIAGLIADDAALTLQLRLLDMFGDNGIISLIAGRREMDAIRLHLWLMSCRVLGRGVEEETLNLVVEEARRLGATRLIGEYRPTAKNGMVREHYARLGFTLASEQENGTTVWTLPLAGYERRTSYMIREPAGTVDAELAPAA